MSSDETDRIPWCFECDAFANPTDDGECGQCGTDVVMVTGPPSRDRSGKDYYGRPL